MARTSTQQLIEELQECVSRASSRLVAYEIVGALECVKADYLEHVHNARCTAEDEEEDETWTSP